MQMCQGKERVLACVAGDAAPEKPLRRRGVQDPVRCGVGNADWNYNFVINIIIHLRHWEIKYILNMRKPVIPITFQGHVKFHEGRSQGSPLRLQVARGGHGDEAQCRLQGSGGAPGQPGPEGLRGCWAWAGILGGSCGHSL